ncbi:MAG: diguanylate cyclase [Bacillota bacterium]|nr:diguanylate cyclase [Bacillota bacterium]
MNIKSKNIYLISIFSIIFANIILSIFFSIRYGFISGYLFTLLSINLIFLVISNYIYKKYIVKDDLLVVKRLIEKSKNPMIFSQGLKIKFMNKACNNMFEAESFANLSLGDLFQNLDYNTLSDLASKQKPSMFKSDFNNSQSTYLIMPSEFNLQDVDYYKLNIYPIEEFFSIFDIKKDPLILNVFDNLDTSILILDENRNITYLNKSSAKLLNCSSEEDLHFNDLIQSYNHNIKFLEDLSKAYQGQYFKSVDYINIRIKNNLINLKYSIFPITINSNVIGVSIVFEEKSPYTKALEKNTLSKVLQEHSDFGIYKYDSKNNLVELSEGASYLLYKEFKAKTVSSDEFFNIINKKEFIENYESNTISKKPYIEKFVTHTKLKRINYENYFKILGIIEDRENSGFIGNYGYILDISDYYMTRVEDIASAAIGKLSDEVLLLDLSGSVIYANNKAAKTFDINNSFACCYYDKHQDLNKDWWYHELIPKLSSTSYSSIILDFNNPKKFIQFKHYMVEINNKQHVYIIGRDVTEDRKFQKELKLISNYDQLTQVYNRRGIYDNMSVMFSKNRFAVAILDLDNFKPVNDTYGHLAGDVVIATFAKRLKNASPDGCLVGRLSGDEFIVLIPEYGSPKNLESIIETIHESVTNKYVISQGVCSIGASIGISLYPENGTSRNDLFRKADEAMYSVKKSGKNGYLIYSNLL